jgi:mono/diheme cytochrome c family protein
MDTMHQRTSVSLTASFLALSLVALSRAVAGAVEWPLREQAPMDYAGQVKPILTRHCVSCHGQAKAGGGLRLDTAAAAIKGGKSGSAVIPGHSEESPLIAAIRGEGATERMPLKRAPLSESEVHLLQDWIDHGAKAIAGERPGVAPTPSHWAFIPPVRPVVPEVTRPEWGRNPIDRFVQARLERAGIAPSSEADRATLVRRASLDLVGLPPSPAEVDAFLADPSERAYERAVDRLMASPHFGERWGRVWLDQARYADSNGFAVDAPRSIWKYRDWVIAAFNADMPFDQFTIDQIAGDVRPAASLAARIATGFHRNTPLNQEQGIDNEQFRIDAIVDRVNTTGTVFLGLTIGCAQCHDHKYDPLTQRDYYRFFAFFNNVDEPEIKVVTSAEIKGPRDPVSTAITTMVMRERSGEPRPTHIHVGGDFTRKGDRVEPGVPAVLPRLEDSSRGNPPNRLDLARWMVDRRNPLAARVVVNRIWQTYFGRGLVETDNDFGTQGALPSHPELLDWLACELMDRGWRQKEIHRLIVCSATYRQASRGRPDGQSFDPDNRLLWRQTRLRLDAELIRDAALTCSGLLARVVGGPSVFPPQPEGAMDVAQIRRSWQADTGPNRYRRGLYTFFWRATPNPFLTTFDAPGSVQACTRRFRSNTPLQALTLLNDPAFVEIARGLAARVVIERPRPASDRERLRHAFMLCLGRTPLNRELDMLEAVLRKQTGFDETIGPGWTTVARVLLNLDEFVTRE